MVGQESAPIMMFCGAHLEVVSRQNTREQSFGELVAEVRDQGTRQHPGTYPGTFGLCSSNPPVLLVQEIYHDRFIIFFSRFLDYYIHFFTLLLLVQHGLMMNVFLTFDSSFLLFFFEFAKI